MKWFKCCKCGDEKPQVEFYRDKSKATGHKPRCKPCDLLSRDKGKRAVYEKQYWGARRLERRVMILKSHNSNAEHHKEQRKKYLQTDEGRAMYRRQTQTRYARFKNAFIEAVDPKNLYLEQGGKCYLCGGLFEFSDMECDHVIPLALGGDHIKSNCKMACRSCNRSKGAKLLEELAYQMV